MNLVSSRGVVPYFVDLFFLLQKERSLHVVPNFDDLSCYGRKGESKGKGCFTVHVILSKFI
ncbi:hypothetical protein EJB05_47267 [Eragrostis curvula]|uniref:Uncharacterized protein n=1 Tax=Eragrostis curvula TaxID=38414 RepID=A0A5J9T786_9POAL|nr:hypothetical protein EJB05_47267 [Eragrostis curvula]